MWKLMVMMLLMVYSCNNNPPMPNVKPYKQLNLVWRASITADVTYNLYRSVNNGPYASLANGIVTTGYQDKQISPKTTYCYFARANNGEESVNSNTFCFTNR